MEEGLRPRMRTALLLISGLVSGLGAVLAAASSPGTSGTAPRAVESPDVLFAEIAAVLRHPRCQNCHTFTDFPRQGDNRLPHAMSVRRGPDNQGRTGMECSSCHQDANQAESGVPGAPHWGLAPLSMGWEGLSDHQLAEVLKDPDKNGGRDLEALYEHMAHDPLVAWAWNPGSDRRPPPVSHAEFAQRVREWIDTGAVSPPEKPEKKEAP